MVDVRRMLTATRGRGRLDWTDWLSYAYLVFGIVLMFGPVLWLLLSSFKSAAALNEFPPSLLPYGQAATKIPGREEALPLFRVKLPDGKILIPGVIESKTNFVEHPELVAQRIGRYANLVGRENVIAGSDCGYGTWVGQAAVDPDVVWAKMAAMAEGARIASRQFWKR